MELVYRVLWTDNQEDLLSSAENVFREWSGTIPFELIVVSDEGYQIKEFRRKAQNGNRTTLRVIAAESQQIIWVDVENENHDSDLGDLEHPRKLVTSLISISETNGGDPRRGKSHFHMLLPRPTDTNISHFVSEIFNADRPISIICIAQDPLYETGKTIEMARRTAESYAGVAQVLYLDQGGLARFQNLVGSNYSLEPGELRIFPPSDPEFRTVLAAPSVLASDVRKAPYPSIDRRILRTIQPYMLAQPLPELCEKGLRSLRGFNDPLDEQKLERKNTDFENLLLENQNLRINFRDVSADLEHAIEEIENLQEQLTAKDIQRREAEEWWIQRTDALEASQAESEMKRLEVEKRAISFALNESIQKFRDEETESITSVSEALMKGRQLLDHVEIATRVSTRLEDLDNNQRAKTWGRDIWKAFLAFEAYARAGFSGNFYQWCSSGNDFSWFSQSTAVKESDTVRNDERLYAQRVLPVSTDVEPTGKIFMESHLKFRGSMAPRLYFFDDTKGKTRKVHVGGIDPHSRWENTTT